MGNIGLATTELRLGNITAEQFDEEISANVRGVAKRVMRMLRCPDWYSVEDLIQELRLSAWLKAWTFDEDRGVDVGHYVLWGLFADGKKRAHAARHGRRRKDELTRDVPIEARRGAWLYGAEPAEDESPAVPAYTEPDQGLAREHLQALGQACRSDADRLVLAAILSEGALVPAARALMRDEQVRRKLGLTSDVEAEEVVARAARRVVLRLRQEEAA